MFIDACIANERKATNGNLGFQTHGFPKRIIFNASINNATVDMGRKVFRQMNTPNAVKQVIGVLVVGVVFCGVSFLALVFFVRNQFRPKMYSGTEAVESFVRSDSVLARQWITVKALTAKGEVLDVYAVGPMLQAGARFYVRGRYPTQEVDKLTKAWQNRRGETGGWSDGEMGVEFSGVEYCLEGADGDGPKLHAVIDADQEGVIHYFAYAGDG